MRQIHTKAKITKITKHALWKKMTKLEDYPKWCKYCKTITVTEVIEGAKYEDVTTLLWAPMRIKHVVTKVKPLEELHVFLPLPFGGKMWQKFFLQQDEQNLTLITDITFDLGNRFINATIGKLLERRWMDLIISGLPEADEIKRII